MASNRIEFKRLLGRVGAVLMIGTLMVFTFTGCNKKVEPEKVNLDSIETIGLAEKADPVRQMETLDFSKEVSANEVEEGFDIEKEVTEYTIDFSNAANEDIKVKENEEVIIPEFKQETFFDVLNPSLQGAFELRDEGAYYKGHFVTGDYETIEDKVILKNVVYAEESHYQVRYIVEDNKIQPKDIVKGIGESGISYVLDLNTLTLQTIQDLMGNDIKTLPVNIGNCIGWSNKQGSAEPIYRFNDKTIIIGDTVLYPVYEARIAFIDNDGNKLDLEGNIIQIEVKDGNLTYTGKDNKIVNENNELINKPVEEKKEEIKQESRKDNKKTENKDTTTSTVSTVPTETVIEPVVQPTPQPNTDIGLQASAPVQDTSYDTSAMEAEWGGFDFGGAWSDDDGDGLAATWGMGIE